MKQPFGEQEIVIKVMGNIQNIPYSYFPKGIDNLIDPEAYNNSEEFQRLNKLCNDTFERQQNGEFDSFYSKIESIDRSKYFINYGLFHLNERAHNVQLTEIRDSILYSICLNISIIKPFYITYVLKTPVDLEKMRLNGQPAILEFIPDEYKGLIADMEQIAQEKFKAEFFPEKILYNIIPDLSHQFIRLGHFSFFNAFFIDKYLTRL